MGPELENKQNTDMFSEASAKKQNRNDSKELEASNVNCASNYKDYTSLVKQVKEVHGSEDDEIDITECTGPADNVLVQSDREELTESSSSFESIISEAENWTATNGTECTSEYNGDATSELASGDIFRMARKKVTPHWREFIQPLRQRCKLIELKLHMLQSQTQKYEKQMRDNNHQMKLQMGSVRLEDLGSKSIPFTCNSLRDKVVKRKKRRTDDPLDIAAYMSHHPLFSFFEKRPGADGTFPDNELDKIAICSDKINADDEFEIQDDLHQQPADGDTSVEKILRNIGVLQSKVIQLKTRLDKVTSEKIGLFSSTDELKSLLPSNALTSSARGSAFLQENRVKMPVGSPDVVSQLISEYNMVMPDSAASRHGKAVNVSDVIENTGCSLLLDTNTNPEDGVLIYNQRMKEEMSNFEELKIHSVEKPWVMEDVQKVTIPASVPDPDTDIPMDDQPAPKIRSISKLTAPKSKKRKPRRRAGSGKRN